MATCRLASAGIVGARRGRKAIRGGSCVSNANNARVNASSAARGGQRRHSFAAPTGSSQSDNFNDATNWTAREMSMAMAVGLGASAWLTLDVMEKNSPNNLTSTITRKVTESLQDKKHSLLATTSAATVPSDQGWCAALQQVLMEHTSGFRKPEPKPLIREQRYDASIGALQGDRPYMEDTCYVGDQGRFVAVFDGHGGSRVSSLLRERLYKSYAGHLDKKRAPSLLQRQKSIRAAFDQVNREVLKLDELEFEGSTAVAVTLHHGPNGQRTLVSANVGDSRAVLSRSGRAMNLTRDHKPDCAIEQARLNSIGEAAEWDAEDGIYRVGDLAVARSIGDRYAGPAITGEVEIMSFPVSEERDEFVVLASDGLWDVMTSQDVISFIHENLDSAENKNQMRDQIGDLLAEEAWWRGSSDNICVALVWLK